METTKENIIKAYNVAKETGADSTCKVLEALYPTIDFTPKDNRPVTERIKTFEDACEALGDEHGSLLCVLASRPLECVCVLRLSPLFQDRHARGIRREAVHRPLDGVLPHPQIVLRGGLRLSPINNLKRQKAQ